MCVCTTVLQIGTSHNLLHLDQQQPDFFLGGSFCNTKLPSSCRVSSPNCFSVLEATHTKSMLDYSQRVTFHKQKRTTAKSTLRIPTTASTLNTSLHVLPCQRFHRQSHIVTCGSTTLHEEHAVPL